MVPHIAAQVTVGTWINFRLQILYLGNFPVLILKLGLIFSFAFCCCRCVVAVTVQLGFPWCVRVAGSSSCDAAVFSEDCDIIRNLRYRIFCATLCLFLKPSNRKFPCLESFTLKHPFVNEIYFDSETGHLACPKNKTEGIEMPLST